MKRKRDFCSCQRVSWRWQKAGRNGFGSSYLVSNTNKTFASWMDLKSRNYVAHHLSPGTFDNFVQNDGSMVNFFFFSGPIRPIRRVRDDFDAMTTRNIKKTLISLTFCHVASVFGCPTRNVGPPRSFYNTTWNLGHIIQDQQPCGWEQGGAYNSPIKVHHQHDNHRLLYLPFYKTSKRENEATVVLILIEHKCLESVHFPI